MGHSDSTPFAGFPKFLEDDKPSWLGDWNDAMDKLDTQVSTQARTIETLSAQVAQLLADVATLKGAN